MSWKADLPRIRTISGSTMCFPPSIFSIVVFPNRSKNKPRKKSRISTSETCRRSQLLERKRRKSVERISEDQPAPLVPTRRHRSPARREREKPSMRGADPGGGCPSIPGYVKRRFLTSTTGPTSAAEVAVPSFPIVTLFPLSSRKG